MKPIMLAVTSLCLLLCWMIPVGSMKIIIISTEENDFAFPLDMSKDSVDDMYSTCSAKMEKIIKMYFKNETQSGLFKDAWKKAEKCAKRKMTKKDNQDTALTKDHIQAICVYSSEENKLYTEFNTAVRTQRDKYGSTFPFHSLYFWLTRVVHILNNDSICYTTYRRTRAKFTGKVNQEIRFGNFASSSKLTTLSHFGDATCYKIKTCKGAFLKEYPVLGNKEQEVLIPPYEKFRITKKCETKECKSAENLSDCKTVYVVESTGVLSNLDCQLTKRIIV